MIFNPQYTITHKILDNIVDINRLTVELNNKKIPHKLYAEKLHKTNEMDTYQIFALLQNYTRPQKVRDALNKRHKDKDPVEIQMTNYYQILNKFNKFKKRNFDPSFVLDIHKELTKDTNEVNPGNFRKENIFIKKPNTNKIRYSPPNHKDVEKLTKNLIKYTTREEINTIILAGIFHKQFTLIQPLPTHNYEVGHILTRILLSKLELNFFNLLNLEQYYIQNPSRYFEKIEGIGNYYAIKDKIDFTPWLEYFTEGILEELLNMKQYLKKTKGTIRKKLRPEQEKILNHIQQHGSIDDSEYSLITDRKKSTRVVDFNKLIEMDLIERQGKARQTFYTLKNEN